MKKMIFMAGVVLCVAGFTGYSAHENHKSNNSSLLIQNIEALTQSEISQTGCRVKEGSMCHSQATTADVTTINLSLADYERTF
jgi:predicted negative regulator of RcsB-dependent stress response